MGQLNNKVALVTGASRGIGKAIAIGLAKEGANLVLAARGIDGLKKTEALVIACGVEADVVPTDVTSERQIDKLFAKTMERFGRLDILVNNAGITKDTTFRKMTKDQWDAVMNINLDSLYNVTKQVIDHMTSSGWGRIINISSINGQKGQIGQTNYTTSKAGMHGFTMSLAQEVARKGVTVNTVSPGYIATEMVMAVPEEIREKIIAGIPVGRLGTSEEIAALVGFLCSEEAGFATGSDFSINGGQHMM